ncbi:D-2-hydroxyacid dehydrogenase [Vibrio mangrovi]|uniref:D-2-hydroxyacid dehydrogenase n=1 Tax=Vibrio mangrovi TaxID=474394 RepID=A0A1Y6IZD4_9VIBR|nr:D-2-hydroxyacid dehydrogenase [Vibrio mangrovi]MDW6002891.1 D-2-hydroxyacid dehydrogenase [Vibrio mangrovi]SMS02381.1 Putative 2-hydroxyacid dehydrogenase [Vibrio mangrovi]
MSLPTVVFVDRATIPSHIHLPALPFEHQWVSYDETQPDQLLERVRDAEIIITNKVVLNADVLSQLTSLRLVAVAATGVNNVDIDYCREHGIAVTNVQGYATRSVPEHVIGMTFALRRNLMAYHNDIARGEWQRRHQFCFFTHPIGDVAGSTIGIIGSGTLGRATAQLAKAVGMKVLFAERKGASSCRDGFLPFETVLRQADVISLHCPLNEATHHLLTSHELSMMKSTAILINTGRGGLVDEKALVDALMSGAIAAAGVDVFTQEPADDSNSLLANNDLPNLLLTPHIAWGSDSAIQQLVHILIENIIVFHQGQIQNRIV